MSWVLESNVTMCLYSEERLWGFGGFGFCLKGFYEAKQSLCNFRIGPPSVLCCLSEEVNFPLL